MTVVLRLRATEVQRGNDHFEVVVDVLNIPNPWRETLASQQRVWASHLGCACVGIAARSSLGSVLGVQAGDAGEATGSDLKPAPQHPHYHRR